MTEALLRARHDDFYIYIYCEVLLPNGEVSGLPESRDYGLFFFFSLTTVFLTGLSTWQALGKCLVDFGIVTNEKRNENINALTWCCAGRFCWGSFWYWGVIARTWYMVSLPTLGLQGTQRDFSRCWGRFDAFGNWTVCIHNWNDKQKSLCPPAFRATALSLWLYLQHMNRSCRFCTA